MSVLRKIERIEKVARYAPMAVMAVAGLLAQYAFGAPVGMPSPNCIEIFGVRYCWCWQIVPGVKICV